MNKIDNQAGISSQPTDFFYFYYFFLRVEAILVEQSNAAPFS